MTNEQTSDGLIALFTETETKIAQVLNEFVAKCPDDYWNIDVSVTDLGVGVGPRFVVDVSASVKVHCQDGVIRTAGVRS